jgi:hypothetical protein
MGCVPYDPDMACCDDWTSHDAALRQRATALAWSALRHLTAGRVGNCPVLIRPCRSGCVGASDSVLNPDYRDGKWYNTVCGTCGGTGCSCSSVCEVVLPGEVAAVGAVFLGGARLDETAWRVDNGNRLVRTDGDCWPTCQDMSQAWDGPDAFSVVFLPGVWPGPDGLWAAGVLACEFAKACTGAKCRLPSSVRSLTRQGLSMSFTEGMFAGGQTGIREVDAYVASLNPFHVKVPSRVWSPDLAASNGRYQTQGSSWPPFMLPAGTGPFSWHFATPFDRVSQP